MASFKLLALAACLSASMAAPQSFLHAPLATNLVRAAPVQTVVSHAATPLVRSVAHAAPFVVPTVSHAVPAVSTFAQPGPVVRTIQRSYGFPAELQVDPVDLHPQYNYGYSVQDALSGDYKNSQEARDGNLVTGSYTVADPDGRIRHVEYVADEGGFRADVSYDGAQGPVAVNNDISTALATSDYGVPPTTVSTPVGPISPVAPAAVVRTNIAPVPIVRAHAAPAAIVRAHVPFQTVAHQAPLVSAVRTFPTQTLIHA